MPKPTFKPKFKPGNIVYCSTIEAIGNPIKESELLSLEKKPPLRVDVVMWTVDGKPINGSIVHDNGETSFSPSEDARLGPYYYLCRNTVTSAHHLVFEQSLSTVPIHS